MVEWKEYRIKDLGEVVTGNTPPTSNREYYGTEYKFIKPTDMVEGQRFVSTTEEYYSELAYQKYKKCLLPPKTPCVVTIGSLGKKMCLTDTECFTNQAVNAVIPNKENDGEFLYYAFKASVLAYVKQLDSGTTSGRENVSKSSFSKIKVRVPPLPTQQKIASILSAYDDLIQNYKKQIEALQTAASELYKEWFVRFRFPGYKNSRFENGIPEGWKIERLGNLFEITSSKRVFEEDYVNEGIPFYRSKEIIELSNNQEITTELFISNELYAKFKNKFGVPKENDILITSVGSIGNSYQVRKDDIFYFKDGNLTWIKSSSKKALSKYLIYWLKSDLGKNTLISSTIGTSQSALTIEKLRAIKILVPEVNILEKFEQKISSFDIKIQILNKQIANLTQQRDLLLPCLMSGKLEVE